MKTGDMYLHFKNHYYRFIAISNPLLSPCKIPESELFVAYQATMEHNLEVIDVYGYRLPNGEVSGLLFTKTKEPFVIYQSKDEGKIWARLTDDFFGYKKMEDGTWVKRFTLIKE